MSLRLSLDVLVVVVVAAVVVVVAVNAAAVVVVVDFRPFADENQPYTNP